MKDNIDNDNNIDIVIISSKNFIKFKQKLIDLYQKIFTGKPYYEKHSDTDIVSIFSRYISYEDNLFFIGIQDNNIIGFSVGYSTIYEYDYVKKEYDNLKNDIKTDKKLLELKSEEIRVWDYLSNNIDLNKTIYISELGIDASFRKKGYGIRLFKEIISNKCKSYSQILLRTKKLNTSAINLYKNKFGFVEVENSSYKHFYKTIYDTVSMDERFFLYKNINSSIIENKSKDNIISKPVSANNKTINKVINLETNSLFKRVSSVLYRFLERVHNTLHFENSLSVNSSGIAINTGLYNNDYANNHTVIKELIHKKISDIIEYLHTSQNKSLTVKVFTESGGNATGVIYNPAITIDKHIELANNITNKYKMIEQVAFILDKKDNYIKFRMAGGELCGNAIMAMGAYANNMKNGRSKVEIVLGNNFNNTRKYEIDINNGITKVNYLIKNLKYDLNKNIIHLDGISHVIIEDKISDINKNESDIRSLLVKYDIINKPASGILYTKIVNGKIHLNPYIYVKDINRCVNETACGSGSLAVVILKSLKENRDIINIPIIQPTGKPIYVSVILEGNNNLYIELGSNISDCGFFKFTL